jgi:hypothetical protein
MIADNLIGECKRTAIEALSKAIDTWKAIQDEWKILPEKLSTYFPKNASNIPEGNCKDFVFFNQHHDDCC